MASRFIKYDLEQITDYLGFEDMCHDLMSNNGFKNIEPLGGFKDKGRDAIHIDKSSNITTIFCYSVREDYEKKLFEDTENIKINNHKCDNINFITTNEISSTKKDNLKKEIQNRYNWALEIYDINRLSVFIENHCNNLIQLYPNIFILSSKIREDELTKYFDKKIYAEYLLGMYQFWQNKYTPLLADYREIDTYVIKEIDDNSEKGIIITDLPNECSFSIILGESGAGKTTSLWKIIVDKCNNIIKKKSDKLPILINLRRWDNQNKCQDLTQESFDLLGFQFDSIENELKSGNCLILIDGLNELPPDNLLKNNAYHDVRQFLYKYHLNNFILCCRTIDFKPRFLNLEELSNKFPQCNIFEIRRINQNQIISYIKNHLDENKAEELIISLDVTNESKWKSKKSILHLARIPLYLQLIINDFKFSGQLPNNIAKLIKSFINIIIEREHTKNSSFIDIYAKERLLGKLAYKLLNYKYSLSIPENIIHSILQEIIITLKNIGLLEYNLIYGNIWQEILSNNFLKVSNRKNIEWIHPLIYNYFLACEIVFILTESRKNEIKNFYQLIENNSIEEEPIIIALSLLDSITASNFLKELIYNNEKFAQNVFISQEDDEKENLSNYLITEELSKENIDYDLIQKIIICLPFFHIIDTLFSNFKNNYEEIQINISRIISEMVMNYLEISLDKENHSFYLWDYNEKKRFSNLKSGVKRAIGILKALNKNKNDFVRFYAAKGLWEIDKGNAANTFKELFNSKSQVAHLVEELKDEWNIE